ncbi:hypothetical protein tb265_41610 [Gemmatimonadetes bacterium T265]|nr:hypothetical protein tb265_41610 [Gemmatimonadetes bacterium T265]
MRAALRQAWRSLIGRPALSLTVLVVFALGVGANAAMLGALDALLLRAPAHVRDADRVARVYVARPPQGGMGGGVAGVLNYPFLAALRREAPAFAAVAGLYDLDKVPFGTGTTGALLHARAVSSAFFPMLGVRPALGRWFTADEDRANVPVTAVVLGDALWRRRFGRDPAVLGRIVAIGPLRARVVGVAPPDFAGLDFAAVDLWLPVVPAGTTFFTREAVTSTGSYWLTIVGRLRDGVAPDAAAAQATAALRRVALADHALPPAIAAITAASRVLLGPVQAARGPEQGDARRLPVWLALTSAALLLAAAANATGLLLTRALERRRELAVRRALGARRRHLARDVAAEATLLAVGSAVLAAGVAAALGGAVRRYVLGDAFATLPVLDARRALLTAGVALVACLASAAAAGAFASRLPLSNLLKTGARGSTRAAGRVLGGLVAAQVALAFVLVMAAGLFAESLRRALAERIGYDAPHVLAVQLDQDGMFGGDTTTAAVARKIVAYRRAAERVRALPGVTGVAFTDTPPLQSLRGWSFTVPGLDSVPQLPGGGPYARWVSPDYLAVVGTRLLRGRVPRASSDTAAPDEVVVSALAARLLWPGRDAVGRCVKLGDSKRCATVVGVSEEVRRFGLTEPEAMFAYVGSAFTRDAPAALLVRTRADADALAPTVVRAVAALDPGREPPAVTSLAESFEQNYRPFRAGAALLSAFGAVSLVLAAAGLAGAVAYALAQRTREVGVRLALGARARHVVWLLARGGLLPAAAGLAAGAVAALAAGRAARALLYGVAPQDPAVALGAAAVLLGAAGLACWLPARRARLVPPAEALRAE